MQRAAAWRRRTSGTRRTRQAADLLDDIQGLRELDPDDREKAADQRERERDLVGDDTAPDHSAERAAVSPRYGAVLRARAAGERDRSERDEGQPAR